MSNAAGGPPATGRTEAWRPIGRPGSLYERVAAEIERYVDTARLEPGDRLPSERELAVLLQVSRPSLREAIKILEGGGRLRIRHGQGMFVREPDNGPELDLAVRGAGLRELFAMRVVLELPAAGWAAAAATSAALARLEMVQQQLDEESAQAEPDYQRLRELDTTFHLEVVGMANNRFLAKTTAVLHEMLNVSMSTTVSIPGRLSRSRRDHKQILEAIGSGDVAGARRAMRTHLKAVEAAALKRLDRSAGGGPARRRATTAGHQPSPDQ
jgi:GntR family transcriptional regulator, transcriptional repressor for pyruvate dehydrogenase complex